MSKTQSAKAFDGAWLELAATHCWRMAEKFGKTIEEVLDDFIAVGIESHHCTRREAPEIRAKLAELMDKPGGDWN